jgi:Mrp family chromosome partitioning ATPase
MLQTLATARASVCGPSDYAGAVVNWTGTTLHVVSGKGGAGKTTIAAALAITLARDGRRTLLMEVEGRQGIAQLFDTPPLPYEERRIAIAPGDGEVWALAVDADEALVDYLASFYSLGRAGSALRKMGAIDFATTLAPGLRDVLLTGKACEVVRRRIKRADNAYDAVIIDAPPTGRIAQFLNVTAQVSALAKTGPIHRHAEMVMGVIGSPQTAVHLVTLLEEMPVQETIDGVRDLREADLPTGAVFVNMTRTPMLDDKQRERVRKGTLQKGRIGAAAAGAGLRQDPGVIARGLLTEAVDHVQRTDLEARELERVHDLALPTYTLPYLTRGIDLGGLYALADVMHAEGIR